MKMLVPRRYSTIQESPAEAIDASPERSTSGGGDKHEGTRSPSGSKGSEKSSSGPPEGAPGEPTARDIQRNIRALFERVGVKHFLLRRVDPEQWVVLLGSLRASNIVMAIGKRMSSRRLRARSYGLETRPLAPHGRCVPDCPRGDPAS